MNTITEKRLKKLGAAFVAAQLALTSSALADLDTNTPPNDASGGNTYGYVDQALSPATANTWGAANSTDTFGETSSDISGVGSGLSPSVTAANDIQAEFESAVAELNGLGLGSASAYKDARDALDADPGNTTLQQNFARAQQAYNTNITTVTNLESAAVVSDVSYNTFTGSSGAALDSQDLTDSNGAAADAQSDAALASNAISDVTSYYAAGAGASTTSDNFADLEGQVIEPLRDLDAVDPLLDTNNNGFLDTDETATSDAQSDLVDAQSDYDAALANPASTSSDIGVAAGALASAQTAYSTAVQSQYDNFAPITEETQAELLGGVLNGSWERDAINSMSQEQVVQGSDIDTNSDNIATNVTDIDTNSSDIGVNSSDITVNSTDIATNSSDITVNSTDIATNSSDIGVNSSDITVNSTDIATNSSDIGVNSSDIAQEVDDRSALIRRESSDGFIHIGNNSMIYDDVSSTTSDRLTSSKSQLILGGGATTDVQVDADLEVLGEASFRQNVNIDGDLFINGNRGVQNQLNNLDNRVDQNTRGIAMVAALQHTTVLPGMTNALDVAAAHFEGETGMSINFARRINENWQINFGAASTTDFDESVIKAGVGVQW